ncbi:MAG: Tat pathway signal protein [Planctomycetia bacterium]|nr:Tat pathway signal protein [Planctomycetia bacterium]
MLNMRHNLTLFSRATALTNGLWASEGWTLPPRLEKPDVIENAALKRDDFIWAGLVHLGRNMLCDTPLESFANTPPELLSYISEADHLRCDDKVWDDITQRMADVGQNMAIINIGEGIRLESHPELAVEGSWSVEKMRTKLARLRALGIEPIPKLNFSTAHDLWLKEYARMVSTAEYYRVCAEVIREVVEIFDQPRFFHLGYDEETASHQKNYKYCVVRQGELWWHDFLFFIKTVEALGVRPWVWADYIWMHKPEFLKRAPRSVLMSNWYYGKNFWEKPYVYPLTYIELEKAGFDQIPCSSNWDFPESFPQTVEFCSHFIDPSRLKGFLMAPWKATVEPFRDKIEEAIDIVGVEISKAAAVDYDTSR